MFRFVFVLLLVACSAVSASNVIVIKDAEMVTQSKSIWAVFPALDSTLRSIMEVAARMLEGIHSVGVYDENTMNMPSSWNPSDPTVLIFTGDNKLEPTARVQMKGLSDQDAYEKVLEAFSSAMEETFTYRGESHYQQQQQYRQEKKKKSAVVSIDASNFQQVVMDSLSVVAVAFTAPWCGHCHRLEPEWREAASILANDDVVMGWVDATVETQLAARYRVQGYPTIKIFPGGPKTESKEPFDYPAERSASALVEFLLGEVERSGVPKPVPQLTELSQLNDACSGSNHLCVLAALPHILDTGASGRETYLQSLSKVARTFRKNFSFLWFEGGSEQGPLEQALGLTFGFPALVAVSLDRMAFAVMHGAFRETNVHTFLHGITTGRQQVVPLDQVPLPVVTTQPWDGKDGKPIEDEDDFDLEAFLNDEM